MQFRNPLVELSSHKNHQRPGFLWQGLSGPGYCRGGVARGEEQRLANRAEDGDAHFLANDLRPSSESSKRHSKTTVYMCVCICVYMCVCIGMTHNIHFPADLLVQFQSGWSLLVTRADGDACARMHLNGGNYAQSNYKSFTVNTSSLYKTRNIISNNK